MKSSFSANWNTGIISLFLAAYLASSFLSHWPDSLELIARRT